MLNRLSTLRLRLRGARFVIVHEAGATRLLFGVTAPSFISACDDVLREAGLEEVWVAQVGTARDARLRFSDNVPDPVRQRIRNVWHPPPGPERGGARRRG